MNLFCQHKFVKHPKYPYTWVSEDGSCAIIQVPALDYETGESTCPELKSTKELLLNDFNSFSIILDIFLAAL